MKKIFTFLYTVSSIAIYCQGWTQNWKIAQSERNVAARFGENILLKNNTLYSSAKGNDKDSNGQNHLFQAGSMYVFELENNAWIQKAKIVPNDRAASDGFGTKFTVDNNSLFVSAPYKDGTPQGAVYLFNKNNTGNWIQTQKIESPFNNNDNGTFGVSLSADSKILAVGSVLSDVFVFEYNGNTQQFEFTQSLAFPNSDNANDPAVFVLGNRIFVGKRKVEVNGVPNTGQVNIYGKNAAGTWEIKQTIDSPVTGDKEFGSNIYAKDDYLLISAFMDPFVSVYKYSSSSGTYEHLQTIYGDGTAFFGRSLSMENNTLVIGSPASKNGTLESGSVFIYGPKGSNEWGLNQQIYNSNPFLFDSFGWGVSISNGLIAVGAPYHALDPAESNYVSSTGTTYVFKNPTLAVQETDTGSHYQLYPNPFSSTLSIQLEKRYDYLTAEVFDLSGRKVYTESFSGTQSVDLHLDILSPGTYMIKLYSKDQTLVSSKIIKK